MHGFVETARLSVISVTVFTIIIIIVISDNVKTVKIADKLQYIVGARECVWTSTGSIPALAQ